MKTFPLAPVLASSLGLAFAACGSSGDGTKGTGGTAGSVSGSAGTGAGSGGSAQGGANSGGGVSSGGTQPSTGGASTGGASTGGASTGGAAGSAAGASGAAGAAGTGAATGGAAGTGSGGTCTMGAWPAADPAVAGPFATITETNVGPTAGEGADGGPPVAFTMFRPMDLAATNLCHPVVTWGNGTGSTPNLYGVFLRHLASHGFVVIASNSTNVARGTPPPMVAGVTWVLEQNDDPTSPLYRRIDTAHVGATGHSQGGFATSTAAGDSHITTMAPLCGAGQQRNLHGPAFFFCGGQDMVATCSGIQNTFNAVTSQPAMFANYLSADHADWITFRGSTLSPAETTITAWMRVQLMGDTALRSWFYGASCKLCMDPAWEVLQKDMDQ
ncbi:MAG TPA: hypothetical protein VFZ53_05255 [Polyangiaceae bacterium]